jgi:hypothetical protein
VIFTCWSAICSDPVRDTGSSVFDTEKSIVAWPCPSLDARAIHGASLAAVQRHSRAVATVTCPVPPCAEKEVALAAREMPHFEAVGAVIS